MLLIHVHCRNVQMPYSKWGPSTNRRKFGQLIFEKGILSSRIVNPEGSEGRAAQAEKCKGKATLGGAQSKL